MASNMDHVATVSTIANAIPTIVYTLRRRDLKMLRSGIRTVNVRGSAQPMSRSTTGLRPAVTAAFGSECIAFAGAILAEARAGRMPAARHAMPLISSACPITSG